MKKVAAVVAVVIAVFIISLFSQQPTYVGAGKCKICHNAEAKGKQYPVWEGSKHSKSFQALSSDKAKAQAPDAQNNPKCLKCHAPLCEKAPELKEEGVTCEVCHGPGSAYKSMSIMKSREDSVKNGLIAYGSQDAIKKHCLTCHENAHDKPFDFSAGWEKIKHPKPSK